MDKEVPEPMTTSEKPDFASDGYDGCSPSDKTWQAYAADPAQANAPLPGGPESLNKGLTTDQRDWWQHFDQGVPTPLPYTMALCLEQENSRDKLLSPQNEKKLGLLPDAVSRWNPDGLPVGFTKTPVAGTNYLGMTCATCHTGETEANGATYRIDGGTTNADLSTIGGAFFGSVEATGKDPGKTTRLIECMAKAGAQIPQGAAGLAPIKAALEAISNAKHFGNLAPVDAGPGRTDALGVGGNRVFGQLMNSANEAPATGNTLIPTAYFGRRYDWINYNGTSGEQLGRDTAEAVAVGATVDLKDPKRLGQTSANFPNIVRGEKMLDKIGAPEWPDAWGKPDPMLALEGSEVYAESCAQCHGPLSDSDPLKVKPMPSQFDKNYNFGTPAFAVADIGTDPTDAENFNTRTLALSPAVADKLGVPRNTKVSIADGFKTGTNLALQTWFDNAGLTKAQIEELEGGRSNDWKGDLSYNAQPIVGTGTKGRYGHNGAWGSIWDVLANKKEGSRPVTFQVGGTHLNTETLGKEGGPFTIDTRLVGNHNTGHWFDNSWDPNNPKLAQNGTVGPELSDHKKHALIEFTKAVKMELPKPAAPAPADCSTQSSEACESAPATSEPNSTPAW